MSREGLSKALEQVTTNDAFRARLASDPDSTLSDFDLTPEERGALLSGDSGQFSAMGLDARVSKAARFGRWDY